MPNRDFFAAGTDHLAVLEFVFAEASCDVYANATDVKLRSIQDVEKQFGITCWEESHKFGIDLKLHPHRAGGPIAYEHRQAGGWGLIQRYLDSPREDRLRSSHTNHNSEKRAHKWANNYRERL